MISLSPLRARINIDGSDDADSEPLPHATLSNWLAAFLSFPLIKALPSLPPKISSFDFFFQALGHNKCGFVGEAE